MIYNESRMSLEQTCGCRGAVESLGVGTSLDKSSVMETEAMEISVD
jgi:hypothetical protein